MGNNLVLADNFVFFPCKSVRTRSECHANPFFTLYVIRVTNRQTDKPKNKQTLSKAIYSFLAEVNNNVTPGPIIRIVLDFTFISFQYWHSIGLCSNLHFFFYHDHV